MLKTGQTHSNILAISSLIGNTPLLAIRAKYKGNIRTIYAKAENLNMTESIKDRMAFHVLLAAYNRGDLKAGDRIIEATSGNTGISFAAIGRALGHPVSIFIPDWMSLERIQLIKSYGADIHLVSHEEGGFVGSIAMAEEMAALSERTFLPRQFSNADNVAAHYLNTGPEIWWQLDSRGLRPDAFIAGVGTGGTVMGVGKYLKQQSANIRICPLEPANSPTLSTGHRVGKHRIQGISDEFIPPIVKLDALDEIIQVDDGDAILMAQQLASRLGLGVGISSGANYLGALMLQEKLGGDAVVVTVLSDSNKKYLSTDLLHTEAVKSGFLSPEIALLDFKSIKRTCHTCCDPAECVHADPDAARDAFISPYCPKLGEC